MNLRLREIECNGSGCNFYVLAIHKLNPDDLIYFYTKALGEKDIDHFVQQNLKSAKPIKKD